MSVRMTKAEREHFLAAVHVGILAVADGDRGPLAVPIWYTYEPGGVVHIETGATSEKARLLNAAGRASLVVQTETPPYKYVMVEGPTSTHTGPEHDSSPAVRYLGPEGGRVYMEKNAPAPGSKVTFVLQPERWLTVDYSKSTLFDGAIGDS